MQFDKESLIWIGIILIPLILWILPAKRFRDDPDKEGQQEIAKSVLRGETTPEKAAKENNLDPSHVKKWCDDYAALVVDYVMNTDKKAAEHDSLAADNELLKKICREHIGDDWETRTGFKQ